MVNLWKFLDMANFILFKTCSDYYKFQWSSLQLLCLFEVGWFTKAPFIISGSNFFTVENSTTTTMRTSSPHTTRPPGIAASYGLVLSNVVNYRCVLKRGFTYKSWLKNCNLRNKLLVRCSGFRAEEINNSYFQE